MASAGDSRRQVTLQLDEIDVGQLLDGLDILIEQWDNTYRYHAYGESDPEEIIRESSSADEAEKIRDYYQRISDDIRRQLA